MATLKGRDLRKIGFPQARIIGITLNILSKEYPHISKQDATALLRDILSEPEKYLEDEKWAAVAAELIPEDDDAKEVKLLDTPLEYKVYGGDGIEKGAHEQMRMAMRLPITAAGALMPDAHQGYGLPIGGVLAANNAVIPYGVGVDIGCRMALTVYELPASYIPGRKDALAKMLMEHTRFGNGSEFENPMDHEVFEREEFKTIPIVRNLKDRASRQVGTSGGGNHFVEFGEVEVHGENNVLGLPAGVYVAVLSHSGSRGLGANVANYYTKKAMEHTILPREARHLAWLGLDTELGQEYWAAMNLAGDYASACHDQIHIRLAKALGLKPMLKVENHHNFAWKEQLADGTEVIVHRKGATPAAEGVLGIIPGSMTAPGYIVRGTGNAQSIFSASHGAGRQLSRKKAMDSISGYQLRKQLADHGVELMGGGLDEAPDAYKDIDKVMASQSDLVEVLGTFRPKIVRMDG